ncbi:MAG: PQQ-binding-like beta-propeller repeat protein [Pirellulales bacterium]|nr:PQQ-binding-like beta-propeller repeat protein [Pirellulales bacterium]
MGNFTTRTLAHPAIVFLTVFATLFGMLYTTASASDWPMWRYDAQRSATSPHSLPKDLQPAWSIKLPPLEPAWEDMVNQDRMPFDSIYEPIVVGTTLLVPSNRTDSLTAYDTRTGKQKWRFYADGPIRMAPVAWRDRVYFSSDDGYLYCLAIDDGRLLWRVAGCPAENKVLGNGRLISAWPARGGPVICDDTVYFAAGIWPFMGIFIYALDADSGRVLWSNEGLGSRYMNQPHGGSISFGSIAPQGAIAATADELIIPGGRSVPGCFERKTGRMKYFHLSGSSGANRKLEGGSQVAAAGDFFYNHRGLATSMYDKNTGRMIRNWTGTVYPVIDGDRLYISGKDISAYDTSGFSRTAKGQQRDKWRPKKMWELETDATGGLIKAGNRLYAAGKDSITAFDLPDGKPAKAAWTKKVEGSPRRLLAADDRLFVITDQGHIHAFDAEKTAFNIADIPADKPADNPAVDPDLLKKILASTSIKPGYCLAFGLDDGRLAEAVARDSSYRVVSVEPNTDSVQRLRRRFDAAGIYGTKITVHQGTPTTFAAPPYLAALTLVDNLSAADEVTIKSIYRSMRPYGGVAWFVVGNEQQRESLKHLIEKCNLQGTSIRESNGYIVLTRNGPLAGSAPWTHQYGDVANTAKSNDRLVKLPLGLLWFGGNRHKDILPRHGHGPPEQVIGGRLFIEGIDSLTARDVYTGMNLWKRSFADLGTLGVYFDKSYDPNPLSTSYNQRHIVGAKSRGTNFVATPDRIYLIVKNECLALDPATGKTLDKFVLPDNTKKSNEKQKNVWAYIGVYKDLLIAGDGFVNYSKQLGSKPDIWHNYDTSTSRGVVVMDRHNGSVLWSYQARFGFRNNTIVAGADKLFAIDAMPASIKDVLGRRGMMPEGKPILWAFDIHTGKPVWSRDEKITGTWLGYSKEHDVLLQAGRASRDMLKEEPNKSMSAYRGADGKLLWREPISHSGPCMIHGRTILTNGAGGTGKAVDLLTGKLKNRKHPLTGLSIPWQFSRYYGCGAAVASEHLLTFRSGAAGFYDLDGNGGTGNLGGFKSGCTSNLIAADGVLNAPDYTRTCTCAYQNQTSLALVHMPENEYWTFNNYRFDTSIKDDKPAVAVRRIGINFGAPGDRREPGGTLWLDYPSVGGPSPNIKISTKQDPIGFRRHALRIKGDGPKWVAASGVEISGPIDLELASDKTVRHYTVRLYFCEPSEATKPGQRIFDVDLQGKTVLTQFDPRAETGGACRSVVKQFNKIEVESKLTIELTPKTKLPPVISGVELIEESDD